MLVRFFLIVYDRKRRHIDALEEFGPSERAAALERRFEFERTLNGDGNIEVVVDAPLPPDIDTPDDLRR